MHAQQVQLTNPTTATDALATARWYAATPRKIDPRLERVVAQIDESWVGLATIAVVGIGVLAVCGLGIAAILGALSWAVPAVAAAVTTVAVGGALAFDRRSWRRSKLECVASLQDGTLVLAHVVQANVDLYTPGDSTLPVLFVFSRTPGRAWDLAYGRWLAGKVQSLKGAPDPGGEAHVAWMAVNDDHSSPAAHLPPSFAADGDAHLYASFIDQSLLPGRRIGADNVFAAIHCVRRGVFMVF